MDCGVRFYSHVKRRLEEEGFKLGFVMVQLTLSRNRCEAAFCYWYKNNTVIRVSCKDNSAEAIWLCNEENKLFFPNAEDALEAKELFEQYIAYEDSQPPTLLKCFGGDLFTVGTSEAIILKQLGEHIPKFSMGFLALYQDEIAAMACRVAMSKPICKPLSWFKSNLTGRVHYVAEQSETSVLMRDSLLTLECMEVYSLEELVCNFSEIEIPAGYVNILRSTLRTFYEMLSMDALTNTLQQLGYKGAEQLSRIPHPIQLTPEVIFCDLNNFCRTILIDKGYGYHVDVTFQDRITRLLFTERDQTATPAVLGSIKEIVGPDQFLNRTIQLITQIIEKLQMILNSEPAAANYLHNLPNALDEIERNNKGIALPESWDKVQPAAATTRQSGTSSLSAF